MKMLLLMKRTSKSFVNSWGGTEPVKRLNRMSRNDKLFMARIEFGNKPENWLLLMSSSYRYGSLAISGGISPEKKLELAWKRATSGSWSIKPERERAVSWKPLKSTEAIAMAVLLSGGLSQ